MMVSMIERQKVSDGVKALIDYASKKENNTVNTKMGCDVAIVKAAGGYALAEGLDSVAVSTHRRGVAHAKSYGSIAMAVEESGVAVSQWGSSIAAASDQGGIACAMEGSSIAAVTGFDTVACTANTRSIACANGFRARALAEADASIAVANGYGSHAAALCAGSVAIASGKYAVASGELGSVLIFIERENWSESPSPIQCIKTVVVDGEKIKANTAYALIDGKICEMSSQMMPARISTKDGDRFG